MTTALVTGITGQDGTILARRLVAEGIQVHGLAREARDRDEWALDGVPEVQVHVGDLTDAERIRDLVREVEPDEIYNLGGISSVAFSWEHPVLTGAVTGLGAVGLYDAAWRLQQDRGLPVRLVQASSAEMFGLPEVAPQDETTAIRPVSPYGAAKAYAHQMAAVYRARGLHVATCILYNHESPLRPTAFVTRKITAAAARIAHDGAGTLALGNLDARRDWGWAPDYVDALVRALRHDEADDFVVATGHAHSVAQFVEAAFRRAGIEDWRQHVVVDPAFVRPADPTEMVGDAGRARRVLGWAPTVPFDEIVGRMVEHDMSILRGTHEIR
ncbi:GDP-mannose 4,6-dehydratase [Cellulomonas fengjieae]|uniref:GDP-mannose 4,6-dehydratase n=1 Tax=Cellulomonas fengjieae TaxID=2819978 RepID=A0ABS3SDL4_9CELL|nr:GDP-mannose 4,6-dehydratase [Cellulomonas fengjieae]MBO3083844.1 GDP-mannose 4,6-dehydratase [Cellulomonas fengjieae]MBO3101407.1 GDP-mannose 4,6-dehydratase [Cellulomonas fengjieae]QVI64870.1 GDP-mannose 4,6-dehydratase [Cellulomonas fengjieae]